MSDLSLFEEPLLKDLDEEVLTSLRYGGDKGGARTSEGCYSLQDGGFYKLLPYLLFA